MTRRAKAKNIIDSWMQNLHYGDPDANFEIVTDSSIYLPNVKPGDSKTVSGACVTSNSEISAVVIGAEIITMHEEFLSIMMAPEMAHRARPARSPQGPNRAKPKILCSKLGPSSIEPIYRPGLIEPGCILDLSGRPS